jgi:hypothetical protein
MSGPTLTITPTGVLSLWVSTLWCLCLKLSLPVLLWTLPLTVLKRHVGLCVRTAVIGLAVRIGGVLPVSLTHGL